MNPAWIACGIALVSVSPSQAENFDLRFRRDEPPAKAPPARREAAIDLSDCRAPEVNPEPACPACDELVEIGERELGFHLGRRVFPDRSELDAARAILPSPLAPNWGGVFQERAGAIRFVNSRRTAAVQVWGDVVPVAGETDSSMALQAAGRDPPPGVLVLGVGVRVGF